MTTNIIATRLHDVVGATPTTVVWSGPAALAAVTGLDVDAAEDLLRRQTGRQSLMRLTLGELADAISTLGPRVWLERTPDRPSFSAFRRSRSPELRRRTLVVLVGSSFVVLCGNRTVDSRSREPVLASSTPNQLIARTWRC